MWLVLKYMRFIFLDAPFFIVKLGFAALKSANILATLSMLLLYIKVSLQTRTTTNKLLINEQYRVLTHYNVIQQEQYQDPEFKNPHMHRSFCVAKNFND